MSVAKVMLQSRRPSPLPGGSPAGTEAVILANGPSLANTVEAHRRFLEGKTLIAVNFCALSDTFTALRPQIYVVADPLFWLVDEKRQSLFGALAAKTAWTMDLFMPVRSRSDKQWQAIVAANPHIRVRFYNTTPVEGWEWLTGAIYRRGLGMPRPHNVLIPSIAIALRMPFEKIYLAGADHSWLGEITVTDDNRVLMHQKHFYDRDTSRPDSVSREDLRPAPLHTILWHMHVAFKAYHILNRHAATLGKRIINITPHSFIDAFPRQKL